MTFRGQLYAKLARRGAEWSIGHPFLAGGVATWAILGAALGIVQSTTDPTTEAFLRGGEAWSFYQQIDREYEIGETLVIGLRETGGTIFDVETVTAVAELDRLLGRLPDVDRVLSLASATALDRRGDALDVAPLLPGEPVTQDSTIELASRVRRHPIYSKILVDERHESTFLFVQLSPRNGDAKARIETVRAVRREADRFRSQHRAVHLAGSPVTKEAFASSVNHDLRVFYPAALALLFVLLWIAFGDPVACFGTLFAAGFSSFVALGALSWLRVPLNLTTLSAPLVILVAAVVDGVQFLAELRRQHARSGDRRSAITAAVEAVALPSLLASAGMGVGFLALTQSRVAPIRELGLATAVGMIAACLAWMLLAPPLLDRLRYPGERSTLLFTIPALGRLAGRLAVLGHRRFAVTVGMTGLVLGGSLAALLGLAVDANAVRLLGGDHRLKKDIGVVERTLGGVDIIDVIVDCPEPDCFRRPEGILAIDSLGDDLRKLEGVSRVFSIADYLRLANAVMTGGDGSGGGALPKTAEEIAQLSLLDPMAFSALTNDGMTQARLTMQVRSMSSDQVQDLADVAQQASAIALSGSSLRASLTGLPLLSARVARSYVADTSAILGAASLIVFIALLLGLRSPGLALACVVPAVLTLGLAVAAAAGLGMTVDPYGTVVMCVGLALAVDHTVHIAARYQRAREEGAPSPAAAVHYAVSHAGTPVALVSIILAIACSVLCLSSFGPTFQVGVFGTAFVLLAGGLAIFLLPALLVGADHLEGRYVDAASSDRGHAAPFSELSSRLTASDGRPALATAPVSGEAPARGGS